MASDAGHAVMLGTNSSTAGDVRVRIGGDRAEFWYAHLEGERANRKSCVRIRKKERV